jgi:biopolymer transport protein ExbD
LSGITAITNEPELHLRPHPQSRYEVVDQVLAIIKREQVKRVGFVANESYARW